MRRIKIALCVGAALMMANLAGAAWVLSFSRDDASYVDMGVGAFTNLSALTVEVWIKTGTAPGDRHCALAGQGNLQTDVNGFGLFVHTDGDLRFRANDSTKQIRTAVTPFGFDGQWHHLAGVRENNASRIYLDGILIATTTGALQGKFADAARRFGLGASAAAVWDYHYTGLMAEVRMWDHARSASAIQTTMRRRLSGSESGLIGYWRLNEGSGATATDLSTKGATHDGAITAATWVEDGDLHKVIALDGYLPAEPFTVRNIFTGSARFTNTNEVEVVDVPLPAGYDVFQFTTVGDVSAIDSNAWLTMDDLPARVELPYAAVDTNLVLYAWFTNTLEDVEMRRSSAEIVLTHGLPTPVVVASLERIVLAGFPLVVQPTEVDGGSDGGLSDVTVGAEAMAIHARSLQIKSGPSGDLTPADPWVTVSDSGLYQMELVVMNEAGNVATSAVCELDVTELLDSSFVWTGTSDNDWHNAGNWANGLIPCNGADVTVNSGTLSITNESSALNSFIFNKGTLTFNGTTTKIKATTVDINGGTVTHAPNNQTKAPWTPNARVWFECVDFTMAAGVTIDVRENGYRRGGQNTAGAGPGGGDLHNSVQNGGSHGGYGGGRAGNARKNSLPYDDPDAPLDHGSGGAGSNAGSGGHGGGSVFINGSGVVVINGTILANGGNNNSGNAAGGSGGAIYITSREFYGTNGIFRANGGNGQGGGSGGGGGRIAVAFDKDLQSAHNLQQMTFEVLQGATDIADIGSLWFSAPAKVLDAVGSKLTGQIYNIDRWERDSLTITNWRVRFRDHNFSLVVTNDLVINGSNARLELGGTEINNNLHRAEFRGIDGSVPRINVGGNLVITNGARFDVYSSVTNGVDVPWGAEISVGKSLIIGQGSTLYLKSEPVNGGSPYVRASDFYLAEGGFVNATELGFSGAHKGQTKGFGPGGGVASGNNDSGGGGGYGGKGGKGTKDGGVVYGSALAPEYAGSGGSSGHVYGLYGGGLVRIDVLDNAIINGTIVANGGNGGTQIGSGSGGGIHIRASKFYGAATGAIRANGGSGGPGGGGGRVAIWYGKVWDEDVPQSRIIISEATMPATYLGAFPTVSGGTGSGGTGSGGYGSGDNGTVRIVRVLPPYGTVLMVR